MNTDNNNIKNILQKQQKKQEEIIIEIEDIKEKQKIGQKAIEDLRIVEGTIADIITGLEISRKNQEEIKKMLNTVQLTAKKCVREPDFVKLEESQKLILSEVQAIRKQQDEDREKLKKEEEQGLVRNGKTDGLSKNIADMKSDIAFLRGKAEGQVESKSNSWKQWQLLIASISMIIAFITVLLAVMRVI